MATKIGCDQFHYALLHTIDTESIEPTFDTPVSASGVVSITISTLGGQDTIFADDRSWDTDTVTGQIAIEICKSELTISNKADLLGHAIDSNGALVYGDGNVSPWVAVGYRTLKSDGCYVYTWLYKGRFSEPDEVSQIKGDNNDYQLDSIKGEFVLLDKEYAFTKGTRTLSVHPWKYEAESNISATLTNSWFDKVQLPV
jgi:phi13 family phage major tail protein